MRKSMIGTYILLIKMGKEHTIEIGKLGFITFQKGWYVYIGSALLSLEPRIKRHLKKNKKFHWHIDYLLDHASIISVFYKEGKKREECNIAKIF